LTVTSWRHFVRDQHPWRVWSYNVLERFGTTVSSVCVIQGSNIDHSMKLSFVVSDRRHS